MSTALPLGIYRDGDCTAGRRPMTCTHEPIVTPVRGNPYDTIYAISVCEECSTFEYVEIEQDEA